MDSQRFDAMARDLFARSIRRRPLLTGVAGGLLALAAGRWPEEATDQEERKKRKKKPLKRNEYGCVPVEKPCRGRDSVCCSGICQGKKPKKGEKDESRCVAHDTGGCQKGQRTGFCGGADILCTTSQGSPGNCETTTGSAGLCASFGGSCESCRSDADCHAVMLDLGAACIRCTGSSEGTACVNP